MRFAVFLFTSLFPFFSWAFVVQDCIKMEKYSLLGPTTASSMFFSSTGECSALRSEDAKQETKTFIEENNEEIKDDITQGKGEHLDTLTQLMKCSHSKNRLYPKLQKEYLSLISGDGTLVYRKLQRVYAKACRSEAQ